LVVACTDVRQEFSGTLHEDAVIADAIYTPSHHDTELGLTAIKTGPAGLDFGGNFGLRIGGGLQISSVTVPEKFAVVFKCAHGEFVISRKEIYEKFKNHKGAAVDVSYREEYRSTYEQVEKNLDKQVVERVLVDYDFIDATLK